MSKNEGVYTGHSDELQREYEREARLQYGPDRVNESRQRWNSYTEAERETILAEGRQIYEDLADAMNDGKESGHEDVHAILDRWQSHIRYFYEPDLDVLRGLGELYNSDVRFIANFQKIHPDLPTYLQDVIAYYVDELETAELERMLAEDEDFQQRQNRLSS